MGQHEMLSGLAAPGPGISTKRRAMELGINKRSLQRILVKDCKMFPYKVQTVHQLLAVYGQARVTYAQSVLNLGHEGDIFSSKTRPISVDIKSKDHTYNYVDRVRLGQSSLQSAKYFNPPPPRGSGWRQRSISNLDLSTNRHASGQYIEEKQQLRPSRSLDYKHSSHKEDSFDIAEFYWHIDPDKHYEKVTQNYAADESAYHSTNLYNQPFDIGNDSCSLRRSRSLAVIREETFSDLQISTTNSHRRSQLIPRARLVNRGFFKERFTSSKQPTYYHHHHHQHHQHHHHQPTPTSSTATLERPLAVVSTEPPPPDAIAPPPETTSIIRESDEYYENLKRLDAHRQSIWQNEKSDLESLNSEYFRNSHHQNDSNGEKQRLYQSRHHKTTPHRKYATQLGEESCPELSQSSVFPETTTTSNSDDQSDSLTNSEQEYDIERVEEILSKVYEEKFEVIDLTEEQSQKRAENNDEQGTLIAYDSVYLSSEESSEGTIVGEKPESASLLHISIEDIYDPPVRPEVIFEEQIENPLYSQVLRVPGEATPPTVVDTKPKILAVVEKKKLKRFSDYAVVPSQRRGVLENLTYISTQGSTQHHQFIDNNQYYSLPDASIGKSLKVSERIDAKLRSSYNSKEEIQTKELQKTIISKSNESIASTAIYESINRFGRAHKKVRQREQEAQDVKNINPPPETEEPEVEKPKEAPSIQVETHSKEVTATETSEDTTTLCESGQFRIIVTDAQNNVIEEDSIDGNTSSLNPEPEESANEIDCFHKEQQQLEEKINNYDAERLLTATPKRTLTRTNSKSKRLTGTITVKTHSEVYKAKDRRAHNTYRARPAKVRPNDSLRCAGKMSRPQVIQIVDSKGGTMERKHPLNDKAGEDEFLQKVDAIRCYWSKLNQDELEDNQNRNQNQTPNQNPNQHQTHVDQQIKSTPKRDFIIGQETKSMAPAKPQLTDDEFQSLMPSIEIVELDGDKQATIVKANSDEPVPEFDHIRYKVMKPNLFRSNILNRSKKEAQFDGLIQYLQEYSFQELLTNNNVVIVEPVRTKIERPLKAMPTEGHNTKTTPGGGQHCKITGGAGNTITAATTPTTPTTTTTTNFENVNANNSQSSPDSHNKLSKRHFYYQPVRVNRELLEEELPTPDTVRNVRKFFEEHVLPNRRAVSGAGMDAGSTGLGGIGKTSTTPPPSPEVLNEPQHQHHNNRTQRNRFRYLTIDTSYGNGQGIVGGTAPTSTALRKWDSVSLSSGISSGDLSSPCECSNADAAASTVDGRSPQQQHDIDVDGHSRKENPDAVEIRGGMHVRDFIKRHNACGSQDSNGLYGDYPDGENDEHQLDRENIDEDDDDDDDDLVDDELCESYYVSEDVLEKIRECGSTVTYYGGRVTMHSPPATGATLRIPRSKVEFLTCNACQPNQCPHKDQLHDQLNKQNYSGIKFKLVKSNSCSSRLELIGTGTHRLNNHHHHPTTIGEDDTIDCTDGTMMMVNDNHSNHNHDTNDHDDGEPLVRRLVHRLETTGKINSFAGPRIIESQCIEKIHRPTSLHVERQKFEPPNAIQKRHSEGVTINSQMVGKASAIPDPIAYVQLLKQVTVNNHINAPVQTTDSEAPCFTSSAMDIRLSDKASPTAAVGGVGPDAKLTNGKVRRNKNVDLAFTMKGPNGTLKKSSDTNTNTKVEVKSTTVTPTIMENAKTNNTNVTIVERFDGHLPTKDTSTGNTSTKATLLKDAQPPPINSSNGSTNAKPTSELIVDNSLVRHYVTNDKRLFTKRKYDDIEFEEFEVYDPLKDAKAKAEQLVDDLAEDIARAISTTSSSDELKSNPDDCYDSLDDKI